jgi:hypothetical protein
VNYQLHRLEAAAGPHARRLRVGPTVTLQQLDAALRLQSLSAATALACRTRGGSAACSRLVTALAAGLAEACCCDTTSTTARATAGTSTRDSFADSSTATANSSTAAATSSNSTTDSTTSVRLLRVWAEGLVALLEASTGASHPLLTAHTLQTLLLQPVNALLGGRTVHGEALTAVAAAARAVLRSRHAHLLLQKESDAGSVTQQQQPLPPPPLQTATAAAKSGVLQQQWQPPPALAMLLQCAVALSQQLCGSGADTSVQQLQLALSYAELICEQVRTTMLLLVYHNLLLMVQAVWHHSQNLLNGSIEHVNCDRHHRSVVRSTLYVASAV